MNVYSTKRPSEKIVALSFLFIAFLSGSAIAFQVPTLSLFLSQEIHASPFKVGLFYFTNAVAGIVLSQIMGRYSDRQDDRRKLIVFCCSIAAVGCMLFAWSRNYYVLVFLGTFLLGLGSSANPQSFALAREYAGHSGREAVMFTTVMRVQFSLAWVIGPPLAFAIATHWGFMYLYFIAALAFVACGVIAKILLPLVPRATYAAQAKESVSDGMADDVAIDKKSVTYLFITCVLLWCCNGMYLMSMPLYIVKDLHLSESLAGTMMGTAAGLEIPIMLAGGYLSRHFRKKTLMLIAILSGVVFYIGLNFAQETWQLLALQLANAVTIGIVATLGMVYFQDLMPTKMGEATTLFGNATKASWLIAGPLAGVVSEIWHYHTVFIIAVVLAVMAVLMMLKVKSV